jgi:hypothetical protein
MPVTRKGVGMSDERRIEKMSSKYYPAYILRSNALKLLRQERQAFVRLVKKQTRWKFATAFMVTEPDGEYLDRDALLVALTTRKAKP